jgi:hypothetical protein
MANVHNGKRERKVPVPGSPRDCVGLLGLRLRKHCGTKPRVFHSEFYDGAGTLVVTTVSCCPLQRCFPTITARITVIVIHLAVTLGMRCIQELIYVGTRDS